MSLTTARQTLLLLALATACPTHAQPASTPLDATLSVAPTPELDREITQLMTASGMVGLGAAVIVDKRVVWMKGYGFADRERGLPFTPNTIMNIGSISKTFTGAALMRAVQEGRLSLDEDINEYLPFRVNNPHRPTARITLRHLATHTSGISDREPIYSDSYHYGGDAPESLGDFVRAYFASDGKYYAKENFLDVAPGTYREYSNIAAGLAGYIVERATGEPLNVYSRRTIFTPLGMKDSGWFLSEIDRSNHSQLYERRGESMAPIELYGLTTYPDGGVRTSVAELSRFFIALLNEGEYEGARILDKETVHEMLRLQFDASNSPTNARWDEKNSGIFWSTKMNVTRIGHGGSDPGVKTEMLADLNKEVAVILFTNTSWSDADSRSYHAVFKALWTYGEHVQAEQSPES